MVIGLVRWWGDPLQYYLRLKKKGKENQVIHPKSAARSAEVKWDRNSLGCDWKGEKLIWQFFLLALLMFPLWTKYPQHPLLTASPLSSHRHPLLQNSFHFGNQCTMVCATHKWKYMMDKNCHMLHTMNVLDTVAFYLKSSYIHESERTQLLMCVVFNHNFNK